MNDMSERGKEEKEREKRDWFVIVRRKDSIAPCNVKESSKFQRVASEMLS